MRKYIKGRGAQINTHNRFLATIRDINPLTGIDNDEDATIKTRVIETTAKSIVNKVESPDVGLSYSLNPYQGCEHGCVYCYARNTHTYWGYSAGMDFETTILVKTNAKALLEKRLRSKKWECAPIMLSGNTDCYQPVEKQYQITRSLLQTFLDYKHPVGIVTKNALILRDIDLLKKLAALDLVNVAISINTLDDELRQKMEPRTTSIHKRIALVKALSKENIPVTVLAAPIVPGLNDHNILPLVKKVAEAGAKRIASIVVRLNGDVAEIFSDWIYQAYPDRASKVLNKIRSIHGGKLGDSRLGKRMKGEGVIAYIIHQQFDVARRLFCMKRDRFTYNTAYFTGTKNPQLRLFA